MLTAPCFAANGAIILKTDQSDLSAGDEITVTADLPDDRKIYALTATLQYDQNVFDPIEATAFSVPDTAALSYNAENNQFGIVNQDGAVDDNLLVLRLRVKDNANVGDTNIALTNISTSDGQTKTEYSTVSTKVLVTRDAADGEIIATNPENTIAESTSETENVFFTTPFIIAAVIMVGVIVLVAVLYFGNLTPRTTKLYYGLIGLGVVLVVLTAALGLVNRRKVDLNGDGQTGYADAQSVIDYLIDLRGTDAEDSSGDSNSSATSSGSSARYVIGFNSNYNSTARPAATTTNPNRFDTNNDGQIDINDAGHATEEAEKQTTVALSAVSTDMQPRLVDKNHDSLIFQAEVEPAEVKLSKVTLAGQTYDVEEMENGDYTVKFDPALLAEAGEHKLKIESVQTSNNKTIGANLETEFEVRKDAPKVEQFNHDKKNETVSFVLYDPDQAFQAGQTHIYNDTDLENPVASHDVEKEGTNKIEHDFLDDITYLISVEGNYCRTIATEGENSECYQDMPLHSHTFAMLEDYRFSLTDFSVSDYVEPGQHPLLNFHSSNTKDLAVTEAKVKIDGVEYTVAITQASDGSYQAALDQAPMTPGKHTVSLESVDLSNSQVFKNGGDDADFRVGELTYFVPKNVPKIESFNLSSNKDNKIVQANFHLSDIDKSVLQLSVLLVDSTNRTLETKTYSPEDILALGGNLSVDLSYASARDQGLKVEIHANYDLGDKYNFENALLTEKTIEVFDPEGLYIENIATRNMIRNSGKGEITRYADKNQKQFWLMFNLIKNIDLFNSLGAKYSTNTGYTVNGINYNSFGPGVEGYNAAVAIGIPDTAGVVDLIVTRTQYATNPYYNKTDDWFSIPRRDYRIEVLKDKPKITNFKTTEDYGAHRVTFKFDLVLDPTAKEGDESFKSGVLQFGDHKAEFTTRGTNEITFDNVTPDEVKELTIKADYDLDTDVLNTEDGGHDANEYTGDVIFQTQYGLFADSTFDQVKISDAEALTNSKTVNDHFFEKNQTVGLYFKLTGLPNSISQPAKVTLDNKAWEYELLQVVNGEGQPEPDSYAVFIPGYDDAGPKSTQISSIILENGRTISLGTDDQDKSPKIDFEILKDTPVISDSQYKKDGGQIVLSSKLNNPDQAIIGEPQVTIVDELGKTIFSGNYQENLTLDNKGETLLYVKVAADYRRTQDDNTGDNSYRTDQAELLNTTISLEDNNIIIKDITDLNLYRVTDDATEQVETISKSELNRRDVAKYYVEIKSSSSPTVYLEVEGAEEQDGKLYLILNADHVEFADKSHTIENGHPLLEFGNLVDGEAENKYHKDTSAEDREAFESLLGQLQNGVEVTLERDYDASSYPVPAHDYYLETFSGHLKGNHHTIKNLKGALFKNLSNGSSVEDLYLENSSVDASRTTGEGTGTLAHISSQAIIKNVAVYNAEIINGNHQSGGLIGRVDNQTQIDSVAITNLKLSVGGDKQQVGGLAGVIRNSSNIKNSYVIGQISGGSGYAGGIVGSNNAGTSTVENCYAKVSITSSPSCGIACTYSGNTNFKNNISFGSGYTNPITNQFNHAPELTGNYYLTPSGKTYETHEGQTEISDAAGINQSLFQSANFDANTWRLDSGVSLSSPPKLQFEKVDDQALENTEDYRSENVATYANLTQLTPYYNNEKIIKEGNKDGLGQDLKSKQIQHIAPVDANGNLVTYLTTADPGKIAKLRLVFTDGTRATYDVNYLKTYDMVATYRIPKLHVDYSYPHYVINADSRTVDNLVYYLKGLTYSNNLDTLTKASDSRIYRDFYNSTTVNELKEFVLKYLSNGDYTNTLNADGINGQIERAVKKDNKITRALYLYNYLRRFYDLDIDGMKLYDFVLFNMQGFSPELTPEYIVNSYFKNDSNFTTSNTHGAYRNVFVNYTGLGNISKFLEFVVQKFGVPNQSMSDWVHTQFKGFLAERSIDEQPDYSSDGKLPSQAPYTGTGVRYTLWDHLYYADALQNSDTSYNVYNYVLPILTLPPDSTYIISTPVQFIIGSQRTYLNPVDPRGAEKAREAFNFRVNAYANRMKTYFITAYGLIHDADIFNKMNLYQLDKISVYDENGISYKARPNSTEDPHHKNFNEVIGRFSADGGINAGAYSDRVEFDVAGVMDATLKEIAEYEGHPESYGENTFGTWSHETAHMIDARLWLENNGRRWDSGGEDYADGNLRQEFSPSLIVMNVSKDWGANCGFGANCNPARIDTSTELQSYYSNVFDVIYAMDYIESLAFLQLTPDEMADVAVQVSYPNATGDGFSGKLAENFPSGLLNDNLSRYRAYHTTKYTKMDASFFKDLKDKSELNSVEDLYDHRIVIYPGVYQATSYGDNKYGSEGLGHVHWYQPHNPYGRPDSYSLKWLAYEMMGLKGYEGGYVEYYSNIHYSETPYTYYSSFDSKSTATANNYKTDEMAFSRIIDNYNDYDHDQYEDGFAKYKKDRFKAVEENLNRLNSAVNVEEYVNMFYTALLKDIKYQRDGLAEKFKNGGGEEACLKDYWCVNGYEPYKWIGVNHYLTKRFSTAVRLDFFQTLKQLSHDFTDVPVYSDTEQQHIDLDKLKTMMSGKKLPAEVVVPTSPYVEDTMPGVMINLADDTMLLPKE